ncbi:MAG: hypothetical protein HY059_05015 [Proteobacteria bacterium]|nr:hypothetical protein [Pseudomonadota bacterium]
MRHLLAALVLLAAAPAARACTVFTGTYQALGDDEVIDLGVTQTGCESATFHFNHDSGGFEQTRKMIFDGVKRPSWETEDYLYLEAFTWKDGKIVMDAEYHLKRSKKTFYATVVTSLYPDGDLLEDTQNYDENRQPHSKKAVLYRKKSKP